MRHFVLIAVVVLVGCNSNGASVPSQPAFDVDVRPILMAHCVRCHGAGGKANIATEPTGPDAAVLPSIQQTAAALVGLHGFFQQFGPTGDCTLTNGMYPADCMFGASTYATDFRGVIKHGAVPSQRMPPAPAPELDDWEIETLDNWAQESPLICSRSMSPDSSLVCP